MGKTGGSSWLTAMKRVFRSPVKEEEKKSSRRREDHEPEEEEKKRGKRRWLFKKPSWSQEAVQKQEPDEAVRTITTADSADGNASNAHSSAATNTVAGKEIMSSGSDGAADADAIAVAMATTAAAQAAVATARAAVEVVRLSRPSVYVRRHVAAIIIQTAFRGYLARRALKALRGVVKLQALVRGRNVRKRANMTLQCIQAMVRVQARVLEQRKRLSCDASNPSSDSLSGSYLPAGRNSVNSVRDDDESSCSCTDVPRVRWSEQPKTWKEWKEIKALLQKTKEGVLERENALSRAFSHQMWRVEREAQSESEVEEKRSRGQSRYYQWGESRGRMSMDQTRDPIKTVEIDTFTYSHHHKLSNSTPPPPPTPSPRPSPVAYITKTDRQVHSASPRLPPRNRQDISSSQQRRAAAALLPNYMSATASVMARLRSQSAPRQRAPNAAEKEKTTPPPPPPARKRLSFPNPDEDDGYGSHGRSSITSPCRTSSINGGNAGGLAVYLFNKQRTEEI